MMSSPGIYNTDGELQQHKLNLTDKVRHTIEQRILEGAYRPDQHLTEQELCLQLGVSRTPLREALRQLEITGYLVRRRSVGYVVTRLSDQDLQDVIEVRKTLETMAARLACKNASDDQLQRAAGYLAKYDEELAKPELRDYNEYFWGTGNWNNLFHNELYRAANNNVLYSEINRMRDMARLKYAFQFFRYPELLEFQSQHYMLLGAIKRRSPEEAESIVKLHLTTLYHHLTVVFNND